MKNKKTFHRYIRANIAFGLLIIFSGIMQRCEDPKIEQPCQEPIVQTQKKIVMLGDSHVWKINGENAGQIQSSWNEVLGMDSVINLGFNGFTSYNLLTVPIPTTPIQQAINETPDLLYLMIGANDAHHGYPVETSIGYIETICNQLNANNIPFVIHMVPPVTPTYDSTIGNGVVQTRIRLLNAAIIDFCQQNNYDMLDIRPYVSFVDTNGYYYLKDSLSFDGLHFNHEGYLQWTVPLSENINLH